MSEATEKQAAILLKNGFTQEDIDNWSKKKISEEIGKILGDKKSSHRGSMGVIGATGGISQIMHEFQSEYEFGKAGNRHKIKYRTIQELKDKIKELEDAGLLDPLEVETIKM